MEKNNNNEVPFDSINENQSEELYQKNIKNNTDYINCSGSWFDEEQQACYDKRMESIKAEKELIKKIQKKVYKKLIKKLLKKL